MKAVLGSGHPLWIFIFGMSVVMILLSIKSIIRVVFPRLSKKGSDSMTYFKDISSVSKEDFISKGKSLSTEDIINESYNNAYALSVIATKKYLALREGIIITLITIVWTIGVILFS